MIGKIYFLIVLSFTLFTHYYEYITNGLNFSLIGALDLAGGIVLLMAAFSYYFNKKILETIIWNKLFLLVIANWLLVLS